MRNASIVLEGLSHPNYEGNEKMARSTKPATTTTDPGGTNDPAPGPNNPDPSNPWDDGGTNDPTPGKH
jgi:hypothetical protein